MQNKVLQKETFPYSAMQQNQIWFLLFWNQRNRSITKLRSQGKRQWTLLSTGWRWKRHKIIPASITTKAGPLSGQFQVSHWRGLGKVGCQSNIFHFPCLPCQWIRDRLNFWKTLNWDSEYCLHNVVVTHIWIWVGVGGPVSILGRFKIFHGCR